MHLKYIICSVLLMVSFMVYSQTKPTLDTALLHSRMQEQANTMGQAFIKGDYTTMINYTYPSLVKAMGGVTGMKTTMTKLVTDMSKDGVAFYSVTVDSPTKIIKRNTELQCTLQEHLTMLVKGGKLVNTTMLIAISSDGGMHWTFLEATGKKPEILKMIDPNLSPLIVIPPAGKPVFFAD